MRLDKFCVLYKVFSGCENFILRRVIFFCGLMSVMAQARNWKLEKCCWDKKLIVVIIKSFLVLSFCARHAQPKNKFLFERAESAHFASLTRFLEFIKQISSAIEIKIIFGFYIF